MADRLPPKDKLYLEQLLIIDEMDEIKQSFSFVRVLVDNKLHMYATCTFEPM